MKGNKVEIPKDAPEIGKVYRHYKGDLYKVYCLALDSVLDTYTVVYEPMYDNPDAKYFVRPIEMWFEEVDYNGQILKRFTLVD
jgi:hypothetical protein